MTVISMVPLISALHFSEVVQPKYCIIPARTLTQTHACFLQPVNHICIHCIYNSVLNEHYTFCCIIKMERDSPQIIQIHISFMHCG